MTPRIRIARFEGETYTCRTNSQRNAHGKTTSEWLVEVRDSERNIVEDARILNALRLILGVS